MRRILLSLLLLSNISFAYTNDPDIISINSSDLQDTLKYKAINDLKNKLKQKYQLDVRVNSEYKYLEKSELDALELGLTNMIIISSNSIVQKYGIRDFDLFEIPFIFNGLAEFNTFNNSSVSNELLNKVNQKNPNIYALTFWAKNYKHIESSSYIVDYKSIKNLNFALPNTEINSIISKSFNSKVNQTDPSTYMLSISDYNKYQIFNYNKNVLLTYHGLDIDIVLVNKRWFNKLSQENKSDIIQVIRNTGFEQQNKMLIENKMLIDKLVNQKITFKQITVEDRKLFKQEMAPVHRYYYDYINKDILLKTYKLFQ